jgi:hypothetical protein
MELLGDVDQMKAHFGPFGDSVNLHTRLVHNLCRACNRLKNHFGHTRWDFLVMWVKWKHVLVHLEMVLISTKDWCTICAERAIGLEIILGPPNGTPR